mgnify:FL=1|jgi:hypothetical protein
MLDFISIFKNNIKDDFDIIQFLSGETKDSIEVSAAEYKEKEEYVESSPLGKKYHILLFKEDESGKLIHPDMFEAILTDPYEYISELIPQDWCGVIAKKTTNSHKMFLNIFDKMKNS